MKKNSKNTAYAKKLVHPPMHSLTFRLECNVIFSNSLILDINEKDLKDLKDVSPKATNKRVPLSGQISNKSEQIKQIIF